MKITIMNSFASRGGRRYNRENGNSLGVLVEAGGRRVFLAGDIEKANCNEVILGSQIGKVDLLKLGHHGSSSSSSMLFVAALRPKDTVSTNQAECTPYSSPLVIANSKQHVTGDFGGIVAVFGDKVALYAIGDEPVPSPW
jgi:hypothetical protein